MLPGGCGSGERPPCLLSSLHRSPRTGHLLYSSRDVACPPWSAPKLPRPTALRVLSLAVCPVVIIRGGEVSLRPQKGEVVAGVPTEENEAEAVLDFAFRAAAAHGVPLRAARAWDLPAMFTNRSGVLGLSNRPGELEGEHRRELIALLKPWRRRYPDIAVTEHLELGFAAEMLVSLAAGAQLLVVGRSLRTGSRYVGHVVHSTLHFANAPIAVVPTK
ncbi:universal stress protein [Streptomyces sp. A0642]|nr:universal stress protein [Streptomyces sp. A0642]